MYHHMTKINVIWLVCLASYSAAMSMNFNQQHHWYSMKEATQNSKATVKKVSVYVHYSRVSISPDVLDKNASAYGTFLSGLNVTGWDILEVTTGQIEGASDQELMYAAGVVEGYLTGDRISSHYLNMYDTFLKGKSSKVVSKVRSWLEVQYIWAVEYAEKNNNTAVGRHLGYVLTQLSGLIFGYYSSGHAIKKDTFILNMLNAVGDLIDLMHTMPETAPDFNKMTSSEFKNYVFKSGRCSALIKVTGAYENLFMSHSSWFTYQATSRIYKHYNFQLKDPDTASRKISFSSYPGFLESLDDFYILENNMVMLQTTNNVFNSSLYKHVVPQSLLAWQRVRVANQIARNGSHWAQVINTANSGTYNNQYMLIDLSKIQLKNVIEDGALTIVEQIPTLVAWSDQSSILRTGYWPSYNVPFHEIIYNMSGYPEVVAKRGLDFSYQLAARAKIFRRDANKVTTMTDFQAIMRYNDYQHDPYSKQDPVDAICARGDLRKDASASGCYDTKVTDYNLAKQFVSYAINGPTRGNGMATLPPFAWTGKFSNTSHIGLPMKYNFGWLKMQPSGI